MKHDSSNEVQRRKRTGDPNRLVSVIVTTHNRVPDMVLRAVASALAQTYHPVETVVVDDSDADYPLRDEVERAVRELSPNIAYVRNERSQGANAARNAGLRHAHGRCVAFLDDDDEWFPGKIERQVERLESEDVALVYCGCVVVDEPMGVEYVRRTKSLRGDVFCELLKGNFIGGTSGPLMRTQCVIDAGSFDELMESSQDYDLWLRIARRYPVAFVDEPLYVYHAHEGSRISKNVDAKIAGAERINEKYRAWVQRDKDVRYMRLRRLTPYYLQAYGRRRALWTWLSCARLRPARVLRNAKDLAMIVVGYDRYASAAARARKVLLGRDAVILRRRDAQG